CGRACSASNRPEPVSVGLLLFLQARIGFGVLALDVGLELAVLHAPGALTSHLDRTKFPGAHERPGLRHGDRKHLSHICQGEKALRHTHSVASPGGSVISPPRLWITRETPPRGRGL